MAKGRQDSVVLSAGELVPGGMPGASTRGRLTCSHLRAGSGRNAGRLDQGHAGMLAFAWLFWGEKYRQGPLIPLQSASSLAPGFLANPQNGDISELLAGSVFESPFARAVSVSKHMVVVPNVTSARAPAKALSPQAKGIFCRGIYSRINRPCRRK